MAIFFSTFGFFSPKTLNYLDFQIFRFSVSPDEGYSRNVPDEGYSRNVPDEGYSRNVPDDGYSRNAPDEGYSRNVPDDGYSRNAPDEGYSRNVSCALNLISTFLILHSTYSII